MRWAAPECWAPGVHWVSRNWWPGAPGWTAARASTLRLLQTAEASWERPAEQAWRTAPSAAHGGALYYFNDVTKESLWTKPEVLAWEKHIYSAHAESGL